MFSKSNIFRLTAFKLYEKIYFSCTIGTQCSNIFLVQIISHIMLIILTGEEVGLYHYLTRGLMASLVEQ